MCAPATLTTVCVVLASGVPGALAAQPLSVFGPPFAEVEAAWTGLLGRLLQGDVEGARRYIHTQGRHRFPGSKSVAELQDFARQMAACRVEPAPLPIDLYDVMYHVQCEHEGERAETFVRLRRDLDGVWRILNL